MAPVFLFGEQVRSIVRSGGKEIKIAEGTRISSAAADLIKEHQLTVITVAPGTDEQSQTARKSSVPDCRRTTNKPVPQGKNASTRSEDTLEIAEAELDAIVDRVLKRFRHLKAKQDSAKVAAPSAVAQPTKKEIEAAETESDNIDDLVICRCEEITRGEIKSAIRNGMQTLNGIKRVTRAGMGLCQGQTCQRLVAQILTQELGISPAMIDPTTARGPVRPLRLGVFANN